MIKYFIKNSFRALLRDKFHSFLNISGLVLGISCSIIIMLYLQHELTYDKHHKKLNRIYRAAHVETIGGRTLRYRSTSPALGPLLKDEFPEIESYTRFRSSGRILIKNNEDVFYESRIFYTDSSVFNVFTHDFLYGDPYSCLKEPYSLVLTEKIAQKYFGDINPLGKYLLLNNTEPHEITGVIKDLPDNSDFSFNALISYSTIDPNKESSNSSLFSIYIYTYLLLPENYDHSDFNKKSIAFFDKYKPPVLKENTYEIILEPLADLHLNSVVDFVSQTGKRTIFIFFSTGLLLLILASINYMNMITARSVNRAKEIGVRKILGSGRKSLIYQFLGESILLSILALILALGLVEITFNFTNFTQYFNINLQLDFFHNKLLLFGSTGIAILIGFISGLYPALYLSNIQSVNALKSLVNPGKRGLFLRRILVIFQFVISIGIVICTLLMKNQVDYMKNTDLGFNKNNTMLIPIRDTVVQNKLSFIKDELLQHNSILAASLSSNILGYEAYSITHMIEETSGEMGLMELNEIRVGYDFLEMMGIKLQSGRYFDKTISTEISEAFIINEAAARLLNWGNPIGKKISSDIDGSGTIINMGHVIGVVEDFNISSLHNAIGPLVIRLREQGSLLHLKLQEGNIEKTMDFIKDKWAEFNPGVPFDYYFLDEILNRDYVSDEKQTGLVKIFSYISIIISCLGLLSLSSYTAERRIKEIGIRKVMGASAIQVIIMLFINIGYIILSAFIIALPLAYWFIVTWLKEFAFKADINWLLFFLSGFGAFLIAFITISYHSIKVARTNPAEILKYE